MTYCINLINFLPQIKEDMFIIISFINVHVHFNKGWQF